MSFKPSKYQEAIFEHIKNSNNNAVVEAVAGSGKSTTLVESMKISNIKDVIFIAFNRHIADEMKKRVPNGIEVKTMHSYGLEQIKKTYSRAEIDQHKVRRVIKEIAPMLNIKGKPNINEYVDNLINLVNLLRLNMCDSPEIAKIIGAKHLIPITDDILFDAFATIKQLNLRRDIVDFIDMVYIPSLEDIKIKEYSLVLVDECQDLSLCQINLMLKMKKEGGRILAVGDRNQSIYGFSGADDQSFKKICEIPDTTLLPLSISYRCSKQVVKHAQQIVSQIEYHEDSPEGEVNLNGSIKNIKDGDFVLCRMNSPLITLGMQLLSKGKKVNIKGVDIGSRIVKKLEETKSTDLKKAISIMWKGYENALSKTDEERESKLNLVYMKDMIQAAEKLIEGCNSIAEVKKKVDALFSDDGKEGIILSTAHKSKGLEAENVHIILPETMPLKSVFLQWEKIQEANLHYVAITRAKKTLNYIKDWNP